MSRFTGLLGLGAFYWAVRSGQFDDLEGAAYRILLDDETEPPATDDEPPERAGD